MPQPTKNLALDAKPAALAEPTVGAGVVRELIEFAVSRGADRQALLASSGIDPSELMDYDGRIGSSRYLVLMRASQALTGEPALALLFGEAVDLSQMSVLGLICRASPTMLDAFREMNRFGQLVMEASHMGSGDRFQLQRRDGDLWLVDNRRIPPGWPETVETTFALMICGTRAFGDTPFVLEAEVMHPAPSYAGEYERVFRAPVRFDAGWNALRIDERWLTHRVAAAPGYVFGILSEHATEMLERLERTRTFKGRVEGALMPALHTGTADLSFAARELGLGQRTLSRKLGAEGTTFAEVLDDLRRSLARHYMDGGKVSISETAYLLGFSDPAAFSRAFKRWTGQSPKEARAAARRDSSA
ncbi:AraC family transcriptional regulator [Brevundimonas sp.]|uniref:AraC family transcriptional regulator n=1 Tax=Brevundimonas sp. TaxID=1871086 RepID=UPI00286B477B|nr:AraC family transcriptional regulator [Brevundimonas sp.]